MNRNAMIARLTRTAVLAAALFAPASSALAEDIIRVMVVKESKHSIAAPAKRDVGFVTRALAKRFGVKAPKGKTSVIRIELPASVWESSKIEIAEIVSKRGLAAVVLDSDPALGRDWAKGLAMKDRADVALAQEVEVDISLVGRDVKKLARRAMIEMMNERIAGARARHERGTLNGKPSDDSGLKPGSFDIDYGPEGAPIQLDCEGAHADDPACQLSPENGDTDPAPNDDENGGERDDSPFGPRDCDPFVDAQCAGGDPCVLGLGEGNPLSDALGCGFLENVTDGAIGPRTNGGGDEPSYEVTWESIEWEEDTKSCEGWTEDTDMCIGSGKITHDDGETVCSMDCASIICALTQTDDGEERDCVASHCSENECL